jgi:hypothetical protein
MTLLNKKVSWNETYFTHARVLSTHTCWGTVIGLTEHDGGSEGFPFKGTYALVRPDVGDFSIHIFVEHLTSSIKA